MWKVNINSHPLKAASRWTCDLCDLLDPGRFERNLILLNFKLILGILGWGIRSEIVLRWLSLDLTDKSTLVQVMACCLTATSHYQSQCWPRSMSPYVVTRPQWINMISYHSHDISWSFYPKCISFLPIILTNCGLITPYGDIYHCLLLLW